MQKENFPVLVRTTIVSAHLRFTNILLSSAITSAEKQTFGFTSKLLLYVETSSFRFQINPFMPSIKGTLANSVDAVCGV